MALSRHSAFVKYQFSKVKKNGCEKYHAKYEATTYEDGWNYGYKGNLRLVMR